MSMNELTAKVSELRELRRMAEEIAAESASLEDSLKAHMTAANTDELHGSGFKITWKAVSSNRLDSKALKAEAPEMRNRYRKEIITRRFCLV